MLPASGTIIYKKDNKKQRTYDSKRVTATPSELPPIGSQIIICERRYLEVLIQFINLFQEQLNYFKNSADFLDFMRKHIDSNTVPTVKALSDELEEWIRREQQKEERKRSKQKH
jgi:hypothetical protein